jgi:hypothetical protein
LQLYELFFSVFFLHVLPQLQKQQLWVHGAGPQSSVILTQVKGLCATSAAKPKRTNHYTKQVKSPKVFPGHKNTYLDSTNASDHNNRKDLMNFYNHKKMPFMHICHTVVDHTWGHNLRGIIKQGSNNWFIFKPSF